MKRYYQTAITGSKYAFSIVMILIGAGSTKHGGGYFLAGVLELAVIFALGELLVEKHKYIARISNDVLVLILNAQYAVLKLGGSYTSMIMVTNIHAAGALKGGKTAIYATTGVLVIAFSLLPIYSVIKNQKVKVKTKAIVLGGALAADVLVCAGFGGTRSAYASAVRLGTEAYNQHKMDQKIAELQKKNAAKKAKQYKDPVDNGYKYTDLDHLPNVVLIFTEGMSQSIVEDARNIMPNVKQYESQSITFTNYFNHTAATYRGIPSELASGFQFNDMDDNGLEMLQDVMSSYGYDTTLMNPENHQKDFASHLSRLGFDHYVNGDGKDYTMSDKIMYDTAFDLLNQDNSNGKPKLITFYTFGTHIGQDSPDEKFGDGSNPLLNRFYNVDYQFGQFMQKLQASDKADNTVVIFTTDHASYSDDDFIRTFPEIDRGHGFCDRIPLLIWYKNVQPVSIDVGGRTSIDMAPTVLDYFNMKQPKDFLGNSLFGKMPENKKQRLKETTFVIPLGSNYISTDGGTLHTLSDEDQDYMSDVVAEYCASATAAAKSKSK